jgi:hypothetical protein
MRRAARRCRPYGLFFDFDGVGAAFGGSLADEILVLGWNHLELDHGEQLIFIKLKDLGAQGIAIAIAHALLGDAYFHEFLLCPPDGDALKAKIAVVNWHDSRKPCLKNKHTRHRRSGRAHR